MRRVAPLPVALLPMHPTENFIFPLVCCLLLSKSITPTFLGFALFAFEGLPLLRFRFVRFQIAFLEITKEAVNGAGHSG